MQCASSLRLAGCAIGALLLAVSASGQSPAAPAGFARMEADGSLRASRSGPLVERRKSEVNGQRLEVRG